MSLSKVQLKNIIGLLALFTSAFLYYLYLQSTTPFLIDSDPYYHIKISEIIAKHGLPDIFPWAQNTLWSKAYCDKDLLFHFLLNPFTKLELITGAKFASAFFAAMALTSVYWLLIQNRARLPLLYVLAIHTTGYPFLLRLITLRTYLWSLVLLVILCELLFKRRTIALAFLATIYVLSYNAFPLVVCIALAATLADRIKNREWQIKSLLAVLCGLVFGIILHPQFSNCIETYYIQNFQVLSGAIFEKAKIPIVDELLGLSVSEFVIHFPVIIFLMLVACACVVYQRTSASRENITLAIIGIGFFLASLIWHRFVEYWVPITVCWCAIAMRDIQLSWRREQKFLLAIFLFLAGWQFVIANRNLFLFISNYPAPPSASAAEWMRQNLPKHEKVFECDLKESARLFFYNDRNFYVQMSDPNFFYRSDPKLFREWYLIRTGQETQPEIKIHELFQSSYVYITYRCPELSKQLFSSSLVKVIYRSRFDAVLMIIK